MNGRHLSLARPLRAAALAFFLPVVGCAAPPSPGEGAADASRSKGAEDEPWQPPPPEETFPFAPALRDARELLDSGEPALAAERLERALRSNPSPQIRPDLLRLLREARAADVAENWLGVEIVAEKTAVTIGDVVAIRFRLRNRRDETLVVPADSTGAGDAVPGGVALSRTRVDVRVGYREIDHQGSVVDSEWEAAVWPEGDIRLEPRGGAVLDWPLDTGEARFRPARLVYRRIVVSGTFRPVAFTAPSGSTFAPVDFGPLAIDVFPVGYHRFLADPEERLAEALRASGVDERYRPHVLFAALFLARSDPARCERALSRALEDAGPDLAPTVRGCLDLLRRGLLDGVPRPARPGAGSSGRADFPDVVPGVPPESS